MITLETNIQWACPNCSEHIAVHNVRGIRHRDLVWCNGCDTEYHINAHERVPDGVIHYTLEAKVKQAVTTNTSILQEAEGLVNGDRANDYGPAPKGFQKIADIVNLLLTKDEHERLAHCHGLDAAMVCKVHMATKLARQANKHKRDNLVDLAGYAHILEQINE